jgi:hypothetical protein
MQRILLPVGATEKEPHLPILTSPSPSDKHTVLVIGDSTQDLGVFACRHVGTHGIPSGSAVGFANAVHNSQWKPPASSASLNTTLFAPGLILTNPGQLTYHRRSHTPKTLVSWHAIPRPTAVSAPLKITPANRIPFNETARDHITYVLENIISNPSFVHPDAKLYILAIADGGSHLIRYLSTHWSADWNSRIAALALTDPQHSIENLEFEHGKPLDSGFKDFLAERARAYALSPEAMGTPVRGREVYGCNCYASGEPVYGEAAMCYCWGDVLGWFKLVAGLGGRYRKVDVPVGSGEGMEDIPGVEVKVPQVHINGAH